MLNLSFRDIANAVIAAYTGRDPSFAARVQFWIDRFDAREINSLTTDDIEDGIDALAQRKKTKVLTIRGGIQHVATDKLLAPSTVNRYSACLGTVFKDARRMRLLPRGFSTPMRGITRMEEGQGRSLTVTVEDVKRLVAACRVSRNRKLAALVAMACTTGWRRGTLHALTWGQINLKEGYADAARTKNGQPHRTPILPWVCDELRQIRPAKAADADLVFGVHNINKAWETALIRADLPADWTFHHCRHIAASILAQSGASVVTIMQALNHKTPMMAMRYSHLNVDSLRDSIGKAWG